MTDLVKRLREGTTGTDITKTDVFLNKIMNEAADEIEMLRRVENDAAEWVEEMAKRLRADNERLRAALLKIANLEYDCVDDVCEAPIIAVAALEGKDE